MVNENNYPGANVTVVGYAGGAAEWPAYDKQGEKGFKQVRIAVGEGYKNKQTEEWVDQGTTWYTHTDQAETLDNLAIGKGDKVRIEDARLSAREFKRKDESIGQAFETRYGTLTVIESKGGGAPAQQSYDDDSTPF